MPEVMDPPVVETPAPAAVEQPPAEVAAGNEPPPAETPVDYSSVVLPKDATIDAAVLERTVAIARERGLSSEQTQAMVDLVNEQALAERSAILAAHQPGGAAWTKQVDAWKAETLADPTLGKTPEERTAAIKRGGLVIQKFTAANPEMGAAMKTFLDTTGLGDRREVAHLFAWLGKVSGEKPLVLGSDSSVSGSVIQREYQEKSGMNP